MIIDLVIIVLILHIHRNDCCGIIRGMNTIENISCSNQYLEKIHVSVENTGNKTELDPELFSILETLERMSHFNEDARLVSAGTENILAYLNETYPQEESYKLNEQQRVENRLAALLHDIGKAGPADASSQEREAIVRLFASENIKNAACSVRSAIAASFDSEEAKEVSYYLERCGISPDEDMRRFWDKHAFWTREILDKYDQGLSERTRLLAASHHYDHGINPYEIGPDLVDRASRTIGQLEEYADTIGRQIISSIDKYEANIRRSGASHEKAMEWLRKNTPDPDEGLQRILAAIDVLGRDGRLFGATEK